MSMQSIWSFKVVNEHDRSFPTVDTYNDKIERLYSYDGNVPNHKSVKNGDIAVLRDKKYVIGVCKILKISSVKGQKNIKYCPFPECKSYNIEERKIKKPKYRCEKKHEFNTPKIKTVELDKFQAHYPNRYISLKHKNIPIQLLKPLRPNPTNSIQELDSSALVLLPEIGRLNLQHAVAYPLPADEGIKPNEPDSEYIHTGNDDREIAKGQIKQRRGQDKFRKDLGKRYGNICVVTGCKLLDILEAAHINPYREKNDHHASNGLLLRADIHTLFDLDLIGIDPETLYIHFHPSARSEYGLYHNKPLILTTKTPDKSALLSRWALYIERQKLDT